MTEPSESPWTIDKKPGSSLIVIRQKYGPRSLIATVSSAMGPERAEANAKLMVKGSNFYDRLIRALQDVLEAASEVRGEAPPRVLAGITYFAEEALREANEWIPARELPPNQGPMAGTTMDRVPADGKQE